MQTKMLEIRDRATMIPALAIKMRSDIDVERFLLLSSGHSLSSSLIILIRCDQGDATYDPFKWGGRTMPAAHNYIQENFDTLTTGDVIDVEYILKEKPEPSISERLEDN